MSRPGTNISICERFLLEIGQVFPQSLLPFDERVVVGKRYQVPGFGIKISGTGTKPGCVLGFSEWGVGCGGDLPRATPTQELLACQIFRHLALSV